MNSFMTLLKREYWENRSSFIITPLGIAGFYIILLVITLFNTEHLFEVHTSGAAEVSVYGIQVSDLDFLKNLASSTFSNLDLSIRAKIWEGGFFGYSLSYSIILVMISTIYLLGSLYDDRKDRSILFWKSLPVSDLSTVMSKIVSVIFVLPIIFALVSMLSFILIMMIASVITLFSGGDIWESIWRPAPFISAPLNLLMTYIIQGLWASPFLAWLLVVSSWTKRKPILVALLPIGIISFVEAYFNRSYYFFNAVKERAVGWIAPVDFSTGRHIGDGQQITDQTMFYGKSLSLLSLPNFWYGLLVASLLVALAVYIRRFRDDS